MVERNEATRQRPLGETDDGLGYIRGYYKVPARAGGRIRYEGAWPWRGEGTIVGGEGTILGPASGPYLRVQLDGHDEPITLHPTDRVVYLGAAGDTERGPG